MPQVLPEVHHRKAIFYDNLAQVRVAKGDIKVAPFSLCPCTVCVGSGRARARPCFRANSDALHSLKRVARTVSCEKSCSHCELLRARGCSKLCLRLTV